MKLRIFFTSLTALVLVLLLNACQTKEYYHDRAVRRARKFLLKEDKTLNLEQREFVKFNKPVIMAGRLLGEVPNASASAIGSVLSQVCIAWIVPGKKDAYVVFGVSDNRLRDWRPNRVIIKTYNRPIREYHMAHKKAIMFAMNNFLYLSQQNRNRIRFEIPETIITDYKFSAELLKDKKLKKESLKNYVQTTFIWRSTREGHKLFVCGIGTADLEGWKPMFGGETPTEELKQHFVKTVSFGQFKDAHVQPGLEGEKEAAKEAEKR